MKALPCTSVTQRWKVWTKLKLENNSQVDLEFKSGEKCWMEMQTWTDETGVGRDQKGQGSEGTGEGTKIRSPSYLLHCLFLECKFFSKAEIIPAFALAWCLALYCMQYSSTRQQMQLILCQRTIYDAIADFVRRAFNESFHSDMLKSTILKSENIWFKIILITVVIDFWSIHIDLVLRCECYNFGICHQKNSIFLQKSYVFENLVSKMPSWFFNYFNAFMHRLRGDRSILYLVLIQWDFMGRWYRRCHSKPYHTTHLPVKGYLPHGKVIWTQSQCILNTLCCAISRNSCLWKQRTNTSLYFTWQETDSSHALYLPKGEADLKHHQHIFARNCQLIVKEN